MTNGLRHLRYFVAFAGAGTTSESRASKAATGTRWKGDIVRQAGF